MRTCNMDQKQFEQEQQAFKNGTLSETQWRDIVIEQLYKRMQDNMDVLIALNNK